MRKRPAWRAQPFEDTRRLLHERLTTGDVVLGEGRTDEFDRDFYKDRLPQSGHDYLIVTSRRLIVAKRAYAPDRSRDFELLWTDVDSYSQEDFGHQWLLLLRHKPISRWRYHPRRRFLWRARRGDWRHEPIAETVMRFSRFDAHAAQALRGQLVEKPIPEI